MFYFPISVHDKSYESLQRSGDGHCAEIDDALNLRCVGKRIPHVDAAFLHCLAELQAPETTRESGMHKETRTKSLRDKRKYSEEEKTESAAPFSSDVGTHSVENFPHRRPSRSRRSNWRIFAKVHTTALK
ncbi:hypothetical protein BKA81DRAFT_128313 [Phyllosticta paracitricarpa]